MKYLISIDHKLKIIKYKHEGVIHAEDIGDAWQEFLNIPEFTNQQYNLLSNYKDSKFDISTDSISKIIEFMSSIENIVKGKKQAIIVNDPYSAAVTMLFKEDVYKEVGFVVELFSTEVAALRWLR